MWVWEIVRGVDFSEGASFASSGLPSSDDLTHRHLVEAKTQVKSMLSSKVRENLGVRRPAAHRGPSVACRTSSPRFRSTRRWCAHGLYFHSAGS